jgi:hypothetical protein
MGQGRWKKKPNNGHNLALLHIDFHHIDVQDTPNYFVTESRIRDSQASAALRSRPGHALA